MTTTTLKHRIGIAESLAHAVDKVRSLTPLELEWKQRIHDKLLQVLDLSMLSSVEESQARTQIREVSMRLIVDAGAPLSLAQRQFVVRRIEDEVLGHGPLEQLLADTTVSDILVNGSQHVYVERRGKLELTEVKFHDDQHLLNIIDRIVPR